MLRYPQSLGLLPAIVALVMSLCVPVSTAHAMGRSPCPAEQGPVGSTAKLDIASGWIVHTFGSEGAQTEVWTTTRNKGSSASCIFGVWGRRTDTDMAHGQYLGLGFLLAPGVEATIESDGLQLPPASGICYELTLFAFPNPAVSQLVGPPKQVCAAQAGGTPVNLQWRLRIEPPQSPTDRATLVVSAKNEGRSSTPPFDANVMLGTRYVERLKWPRLAGGGEYEQRVAVMLPDPQTVPNPCLEITDGHPSRDTTPFSSTDLPLPGGEVFLNLPAKVCLHPPPPGAGQ